MLYCILTNGLLCTPVMMIQMSFFQLISGDSQGFPTAKGTMIAVIGTYIIFVVYNVVSSSGESGKEDVLQARNKSTDKLVGVMMTLYFLHLLLNMILGKPEAHISSGVHQTIGPCDVTAKDISGFERQVF